MNSQPFNTAILEQLRLWEAFYVGKETGKLEQIEPCQQVVSLLPQIDR